MNSSVPILAGFAEHGVKQACGSCSSSLESSAYCFACDAVQPPAGINNPFAMFGLPFRYEIDRASLDSLYERLTIALHPDFLAGAPAREKARAERLAAELNEAYRVLGDPGERSARLLGLLAPGADLDVKRLPPGFLEEMFEMQEEIDGLDGDDNGGDSGRRKSLADRVSSMRETLRELYAPQFESLPESAEQADLQAIQSLLNQDNYLSSLLARLGD